MGYHFSSLQGARTTTPMEIPSFTICGQIGRAYSGLADVLLVKREGKAGGLSALRILSTEFIDYEQIKKEVWFLRWLSHPNIIAFECAFSVDADVYVLTPFYDLCSVLRVIQAHYKHGIPEKAVVQILKHVLLAVQYLHEQNIVHRSIRCSHILLSSNGAVKLAGLRHCAFLRRNEITEAHEPLHEFGPELAEGLLWLAPEILKQASNSRSLRSLKKVLFKLHIILNETSNKGMNSTLISWRADLYGYGLLSDVYSIGITLCEMANGFPPFSDMERLQMLYEKSKGTTPRLLDSTTLQEGDDAASEQKRRTFTDSFHNITNICLKPASEHRWPVARLLTHPFVRSMKKTRSFNDLLPHARPTAVRNGELASYSVSTSLEQGTGEL
uniref:Protein kinase domain-containing protein n=1 Tax=Ascaris lumbricoides TaxID=6252 RepID=A0A0M3IBW7_ASCLU